MGDVGGPLEYYSGSLGSIFGYWHLLAMFSIVFWAVSPLSFVFDSKSKSERSKKSFYGFYACL